MDKELLSKTKLFEKIEICWFSINDMKKKRNQFRNFYREIVDIIIRDDDAIFRFIEKKMKRKNNTTRKNR
jgi:hypothetical protein